MTTFPFAYSPPTIDWQRIETIALQLITSICVAACVLNHAIKFLYVLGQSIGRMYYCNTTIATPLMNLTQRELMVMANTKRKISKKALIAMIQSHH